MCDDDVCQESVAVRGGRVELTSVNVSVLQCVRPAEPWEWADG